MQRLTRTSRAVHSCRQFATTSQRWSSDDNPPPAGGHAPSVANSSYLKRTKEEALGSRGLVWRDEAVVGVGKFEKREMMEGKEREMKKMNMYQAIRDAMSITLRKDDKAVVFGEDVFFGGVFRCTMGLANQFGEERVFNTPLTEQGIAGFGIGLAAMGQTAVAEIQFADYIFPAFDQIVNEAAKYRFRSGGMYNVGSLTIRAPCMAVGHGGLYHSQSVEAFFMQAPGVKVVIPRSPIQAKGLLLASIRDPNPTLFLEPKILYRSAVELVPIDDFQLPLGSAEVLKEGKDLTIISYGPPLYTIETALSLLRSPTPDIAPLIPHDLRNLSVEVIDLRCIQPYDIETLVQSINKTGRCIIVHEAGKTGGVGGELSAEIQERCFTRLEAPIMRITGWDTPFGLAYEKFYLPEQIRVLDAIIRTMQY